MSWKCWKIWKPNTISKEKMKVYLKWVIYLNRNNSLKTYLSKTLSQICIFCFGRKIFFSVLLQTETISDYKLLYLSISVFCMSILTTLGHQNVVPIIGCHLLNLISLVRTNWFNILQWHQSNKFTFKCWFIFIACVLLKTRSL